MTICALTPARPRQLGLQPAQTVSDSFVIKNVGFASFDEATAELVSADATPLPAWIRLQTASALGAPVAALLQPFQAACRVALQMFVAGLAANAKLLVQIGHRKSVRLGQHNKSNYLFHWVTLFHGIVAVCVTYYPGLCTARFVLVATLGGNFE